MNRSALYICYFGVREPLVQSQVIAYVRELAKAGWSMHLLTFEPNWPEGFPPEEQARRRESLLRDGIVWHAHPYTKSHSILAKIKDIFTGLQTARRIAREHKVQIIHGRAHVGTAVSCLSAAFVRPRPKVLFDIRGFNPEESVDAGRWKAGGLKYRLLKAAERLMLRRASGFVMLTEAGRAIMFPKAKPGSTAGLWLLPDGRPVQVIPCCVSMSRFQSAAEITREEAKKRLNLAGRRVIAYVGALGGWYLIDEMVQIWKVAKELDPTSFALIYTQSSADLIRQPLIAAGLAEGSDFHIEKVAPEELPVRLRAADISLSIIKQSYSKIASSPTKLAEYLAAGNVVISTPEIGDGNTQLEQNRVGVLLGEFDQESVQKALQQAFAMSAESDIEKRCFEAARNCFDLETIGAVRYRSIYAAIAGPGG